MQYTKDYSKQKKNIAKRKCPAHIKKKEKIEERNLQFLTFT